MFKLVDYEKYIKDKNVDKVVIIKYGNFYRCVNNDALITSYLLKYKITIRRSVGFPINTLDKVLEKLKDYKVSCIVIYGINNAVSYLFIDNKYIEILYKAKKYDNVNDAVIY